MRKRGTEAAIPKIRERATESLLNGYYDEDRRNWPEVASPLAVTVEAMTRRGTICKGEKTATKEERTIHETERQMTTRWLGSSPISRKRVESIRKRRRGKSRAAIARFDEARCGSFLWVSRAKGTRILQIRRLEKEKSNSE